MQLRGGRWYGRHLRPGGAHGESLPGEWVIVEAGYLNQPWCLWHGAWHVLDQRTEVLGLSWTQRSFYLLAFVIGPQWDAMLSSGRFSRYTIKGWSYHGATGDHGDVGNATMQLTWTLVHEVRASCHEYELYEIARRNQEHRLNAKAKAESRPPPEQHDIYETAETPQEEAPETFTLIEEEATEAHVIEEEAEDPVMVEALDQQARELANLWTPEERARMMRALRAHRD